MTMLEAGALASHFTLLGLDGRDYSLPRDLGGKPALLVFFRVKCDTCDVTFPYINRLRDAYPDDWTLWAISQDDTERTADYRSRFGLEYPVLLDAAGLDVSRMYDPPSTPTAFLVGPEGRIEYTSTGFAKVDLNEISARLAAYVGVPVVEVAIAADGNPAMKPGCMARQQFPVRRLG